MKHRKRFKKILIFFFLPLLVLLILRGDLFIANVVFSQLCEQEDVGLTVFEKVELGDEYFLKLPPSNTRAYRSIDNGYIYDDQFYINKGLLNVEYDTEIIEKK